MKRFESCRQLKMINDVYKIKFEIRRNGNKFYRVRSQKI